VPWGSKPPSALTGTLEIARCEELRTLSANWEAGRYAEAAKGYATFATSRQDSPALIALWALVQKSAWSRALLATLPSAEACTALESVSSTSADLTDTLGWSQELRGLSIKSSRSRPAGIPLWSSPS